MRLIKSLLSPLKVMSVILSCVLCDNPHHVPPPPHHQPHGDPYHHVPGSLSVSYSDHGRSNVQYDYGYGRRNHLYIPIGYWPKPY